MVQQQFEQEIQDATRAYPEAQRLLGGVPLRRLPARVDVGWHGTSTEPIAGATCVISDDSGLDDLIGEVLKISSGQRSTFVYCLGSRSVPQPLSLSRRAFLSLGLLALESLPCLVEVVA